MKARTFVKSETSNSILSKFSYKQLLTNGYLLATFAAITASSKAIFVKLIYLDAPITPIELLTLRLVIALPFFIWLACLPKYNSQIRLTTFLQDVDKKSLLLILWVGFCGYYFASLTDFIGLQYISAGLERLVLFTYPAMVLLIEAIYFKRKPSNKTWLGVMFCYLGLIAALGHDIQYQSTLNAALGVGWVLLSGLSFALYYLGAGQLIRLLGPARFTGLAGMAATLFTLIHFFISQDPIQLNKISNQSWFFISMISLLCTLLPGWLTSSAISQLGASTTANIGTLGPVITIILGWFFLGELFSWLQLVGLLLVLFGIKKIQNNNHRDKKSQ
ncbi:DMT family transporter [Aliikangiella sp. IMCC44359]|uniref:DMT family transporter n=1 Tax=Aliikangiella sp. IMCC44359 TaxID=3459125 RepID=UPI00403AA537